MRKYLLIILLLIIAIAVYFGVQMIRPRPTIPTSVSTNSTPYRQLTKRETEIQLTIVPTNLGAWEGPIPTPMTIPKAVTAIVPESYEDQLEAYAAVDEYNQIYQVIIGQKNWAGEGYIGANGNTDLTIRPSGTADKGPYVSYHEVPSCSACFLWSASPFFPQVAQQYKKDPMIGKEIAPTPGLKIVQISPQLVSYSRPDTPEGLEINGVAYSKMTDGQLGQPFISLEVALPQAHHDLAIVILNMFIERNLSEVK